MDRIEVGGRYIDAEIAGPEGPGAKVVLAHGRYNDMNNTLIALLFSELSKTNRAIRFNFSYAGGAEEPDEVKNLAELEACMERVGGKDLVLIGKSYGSYISVKAALQHGDRVKRVVCIGYPFNDADDNSKTSDQLPMFGSIAEKLVFISGSDDPYCRLGRFLKDLPKQSKFYMLNGGDHSLKGKNPDTTARNMAEALRLAREAVDGVS